MFDHDRMAQDHRGPAPDRILTAQLHGEVNYRTRGRQLSEDEEAAAVAELRELAAGRTDLLAEVAGILIGFHEREMDEPRVKTAARLLIVAGADESLIPQWVEEGRRRAEAARLPPFSRPGRPPRRPDLRAPGS